MTNVLLEYIWLDGYTSPNLRSKVKVLQSDEAFEPKPENCPMWNFDGSSTQQAPGGSSECLLKPVRVYRWAGVPLPPGGDSAASEDAIAAFLRAR